MAGVDIDNATAAQLVQGIAEAVPGLTFVLILVDDEGNTSHVSSVPPNVCKHIVVELAQVWSPAEVDNFVVRVDER